jgi:hypothetical protein
VLDCCLQFVFGGGESTAGKIKGSQSQMDREFNGVWEQCIGYVKADIRRWLINNDKEMVEVNRKILKNMQNEYSKVKKTIEA